MRVTGGKPGPGHLQVEAREMPRVYVRKMISDRAVCVNKLPRIRAQLRFRQLASGRGRRAAAAPRAPTPDLSKEDVHSVRPHSRHTFFKRWGRHISVVARSAVRAAAAPRRRPCSGGSPRRGGVRDGCWSRGAAALWAGGGKVADDGRSSRSEVGLPAVVDVRGL